jgi:hypothetical protein
MALFRRRLAPCALVLTLLQCALLFASPAAACCAAGADRLRAAAAAPADEIECCPPGSHPPGQCPLHRTGAKGKAASRSECRLRCDARHAADFVLGVSGILPRPAAGLAAPRAVIVERIDPAFAVIAPSVPDAPPPRSL